MLHHRRQILAGALTSFLVPSVAILPTGPVLAAEPGVSDTPLPRLLNNRRVIVDTDPGNDDAIGLLMALDAPNLSVEAVTVCPGNIRYDQQLRNALYVVEFSGKGGRIPVHAGLGRPLLDRPYPTATFIHGPDGLGRFRTPEPRGRVDPEPAADAIRRIVRRHPGEVVILALGALTNVAQALLADPGLAPLIKGVQFVGNAGNAVPGFNALADPEAVDVVLRSGVILTMGLGGPGATILTRGDFDRIAALDTPRSRFFIETNELRLTFETTARNAPGSVNGDPMAVALIIDPSIGEAYRAVHAKVELNGQFTRGAILYGDNRYNMAPTPPPNANICVQASNAGFKRVLFAMLARA
ncbi:nucleoside hydrolase [Phenylobacterium sp.]|uniref:nucleoside hydrolase n=1 Tax=Phenylobacterium sp. TaxID=1871053 RepID=UPI00301E13C5